MKVSGGGVGRNLLNQDVAVGLLLTGFAVLGLYLSWNLRIGTIAQIGPGAFLFLTFGAIGVGGIVLTLSGLASAKPPLDLPALRPTLMVVGSLVLFGLLIRPAGLLLAAAVSVFVGSLASPGLNWRERGVLIACLSLLITVVFAILLRLPMRILPAWI